MSTTSTVPPPQVCQTCGGETLLAVGRFEVPCPACMCQICGKPGAYPECGPCFDVEDAAAVRRADR
jgi:hypothetical protein